MFIVNSGKMCLNNLIETICIFEINLHLFHFFHFLNAKTILIIFSQVNYYLLFGRLFYLKSLNY